MLRWLWHWLGRDDEPDPAWRPTGYRYRYTGHDESKARARFAQETLDVQRRLAKKRAAAGAPEER